MTTKIETIVDECDDLAEVIAALADVIVAASRSADTWTWRSHDDSCGGCGLEGRRLLNHGRGMMWCGRLRVPDVGTIDYGAGVDVGRDGISIEFGSGCRDADIGDCTPSDELVDALEDVTFGGDAADAEEILDAAAGEALEQLSAAGLQDVVEAACRQRIDIESVSWSAVYDALVDD
jgi:hypothetical protein